ncbi:MAG: outer membrane lipoprotein carrier protein LolA [Flavobacteriales bacterium]|nr:outer membrane lipoprotein carrier protein LolA [Flavobacteriales bacterium]
MKKTLLILALLILGTATVRAQDDPKSKAIIDKLIAKSRAYTSFEADFSSTLINTAGKLNVKQDGNVKVKGKLFRLTLTDNTVVNDGKAIWTYSKKSNEVTISDPADMDKELDPTKIFSIYEQGFKSTFVEEKGSRRHCCASAQVVPSGTW